MKIDDVSDCRLFSFKYLFKHNGYDIENKDIFLIGQGINSDIVNVSPITIPIYAPFGRNLEAEIECAKRLSIPMKSYMKDGSLNKNEVLEMIIRLLLSGKCVVADVDRYFLTYLSINKAHMGFHSIVLLKYDEKRETFSCVDMLCQDAIVELTRNNLEKALFSETIIKTKYLFYYIGESSKLKMLSDNEKIKLINENIKDNYEKYNVLVKKMEVVKSTYENIYARTHDNEIIERQMGFFYSTFVEQDVKHQFYRGYLYRYLEENIVEQEILDRMDECKNILNILQIEGKESCIENFLKFIYKEHQLYHAILKKGEYFNA